jgi:glucose-6-phosphate 1-dehydrogenase
MPTAPSCAIVIFGASGDLARRKLIPAIYELAREKLLDDKSYVTGFSRSPMSDEQFRKTAREAVEKHARTKPIDEALWKSLEPRLCYAQADYGSAEDHARVAKQLEKLDGQFKTGGNRLFYLATPPETFEPIIKCLGNRERHENLSAGPGEPWHRIILEKPFGHDLPTARELNKLLTRGSPKSRSSASTITSARRPCRT